MARGGDTSKKQKFASIVKRSTSQRAGIRRRGDKARTRRTCVHVMDFSHDWEKEAKAEDTGRGSKSVPLYKHYIKILNL